MRSKNELSDLLRVEELNLNRMVGYDPGQSRLEILSELLSVSILLSVVGVKNHDRVTDSFGLRVLSSEHLLVVKQVLLILRHGGEPSRVHVEGLLFRKRIPEKCDLVPNLAQVARDDLNDRLTCELVECSSIVTLSEKVIRCCCCSRDVGNVITKERLPPRTSFTAPPVTKFRKVHVGTTLEVLHVTVKSGGERSDLLQRSPHRTSSCTFTHPASELPDDKSLETCRHAHGFCHHRVVKTLELVCTHLSKLGDHADATKEVRSTILDLLEDHLPGVRHEVRHHRTVFLSTSLLDVVRRLRLHHIRKCRVLDYALEVILVSNECPSE